uniref:Uncharacterized protein n=1 Tax=Rhizophora mucronata TaxID=61149 RepID=A0A2P2PF65_RHIMU
MLHPARELFLISMCISHVLVSSTFVVVERLEDVYENKILM